MSVLTSPPGRAVAARLREVVLAAKRDDPLAPVTVAVPTRRAGIALRRLLASGALGATAPHGGTGLVNVRFEPLDRVAELLGAPQLAASGRRPLTPPIRAEALRGELHRAPGVFAGVANHPATARSLDLAFAELRACSPATLDRLAAQSERARDIVRLFRAVRARLAEGWYDEHDLALAAAGAVGHGSPAAADVGHLAVFLPRRLSPDQVTLIEAFETGATIIDADLASAAVTATAIVTTTDPDEEMRAAVRGIAERLDRGVPLHRMAILYGAAEPYALLAAQHLDAGRIPWNGPSARTLAHTVAGNALLALLDLPDRGWRRSDVIAWISAAPVLDTSAVGAGRWVPAARWDGLSREAGVIEGAHQWHERLEQHEARLAEQQRTADPDEEPEAYVRRRADDMAHTERLRTFVAELVAAAEPNGRAGWAALSAWAAGLLDRYLGTDLTHGSWPADEQEAFRSVRAAVERLAGLDELGLPTDAIAFRRAVERELDEPAARKGHGRYGDGVYVGPMRSAAGLDVDAVFVVGMVEGILPGRLRGDALLPEHERDAAGPELAAGPSTLADERTDLLLALATSTEERVLLHSLSDLRRGRARIPSRWLLEAAGGMAGRPVFSDELEGVAKGDDRFQRVSSFEAGTRDTESPLSLSDYDLRALLRWPVLGGDLDHHFLLSEVPALAAGLAAERHRRSAVFTAHDGNLAGEAVRTPDLLEALSPTSLEQYAACPFRYFLGRVLRVAAVDKPEEITELSARDKGSLVHEVLELYIRGVIDGEPRTLERLLAIGDQVCARYEQLGLTGKRLRWQYDQRLLRRELTRFHAEDHLHPLAAELPFGLDGAPAVEVTIGPTRTLHFRGRADRVDEAADGTLVVTDYKTGGAYSYDELATGDPVARGTKLQLPLYAMAARNRFGPGRPVHTRYWFVSERQRFVAVGYDLDDERAGRFTGVVTTIVDGIGAGAFPARPGEPETRTGGWEGCRFCDFDSLCSRDRARAWERKRSSPALAAYVALAEGEEEEATP